MSNKVNFYLICGLPKMVSMETLIIYPDYIIRHFDLKTYLKIF